MKYVDMRINCAAYKEIFLSPFDGKKMLKHPFLLDTGATRTTINKTLLRAMGYSDDWIRQNKIIIPENLMPLMADGRRLNAFGIPAMRLTIDGHEILHNSYFLTSDEAPQLSYLLGADILSYFDVFFKYSERRVYYEFRKDRTNVSNDSGSTFAYESVEKENI